MRLVIVEINCGYGSERAFSHLPTYIAYLNAIFAKKIKQIATRRARLRR